jgi:hypothetical protein
LFSLLTFAPREVFSGPMIGSMSSRRSRPLAPFSTAGWLLAVALLFGCASTPSKPATATSTAPTPSVPSTPLPRSSIAAVLEHRGELELTDDQVQKLEAFDQKLEQKNASLREQIAAARQNHAQNNSSGSSSNGRSSDGSGSAGGNPSGNNAPNSGSGMGSGGFGGHGRGGHGIGRGGGERGNRPSDPGLVTSTEQKLDDNDTQAYLEAESVLTDAQRDRARDVAEHYREQLFDQRHAAATSPASKP